MTSAASSDVVHIATPDTSGSDSHPVIGPEPWVKATVPVGLAVPVTVAVKVTGSPKVEGFCEDVRIVDVEDAAKAGDPPQSTPAPSTTRSAAMTAPPRRPVADISCPRPLRCPLTIHPDLGGLWVRSEERPTPNRIRCQKKAVVVRVSQPGLAWRRHTCRLLTCGQGTDKFEGHGHLRD